MQCCTVYVGLAANCPNNSSTQIVDNLQVLDNGHSSLHQVNLHVKNLLINRQWVTLLTTFFDMCSLNLMFQNNYTKILPPNLIYAGTIISEIYAIR